jgi:hypothetical protein
VGRGVCFFYVALLLGIFKLVWLLLIGSPCFVHLLRFIQPWAAAGVL